MSSLNLTYTTQLRKKKPQCDIEAFYNFAVWTRLELTPIIFSISKDYLNLLSNVLRKVLLIDSVVLVIIIFLKL